MGKKKIYHANINKKKTGVAVLILDNVYFIAKNICRKRRPLHNDKVFSSSREYNNAKCLCT